MLKSIYTLFVFLTFTYSITAQDSVSDKLGAKTFEVVKKMYGIYHNEGLLTEVKSVGLLLEQQLSFKQPLKYFLLDTPIPNAFATEGGYVYVTRGLLAIINTKDELAGVMAHEISHVTQHHPRKMIEAKIAPLILQIPGNIVGVLTLPEIGKLLNLPIELTTAVPISSFSRSQEKSADLIGVSLATKAGFQPYGLSNALERLTQYIEYISKEPMKKNILIDHPMTSDRIAYMSTKLEKEGYKKTPEATGTNLESLNNLLYGDDPQYGLFKDSTLFIHPVLNFQLHLPGSWKKQITTNTLTTLSKDKKSTIVLTSDTSSLSIAELMQNSAKKIKRTDITNIDSSNINGLKAYKISVWEHSSNAHYDLVWVQLPETNKHIFITGVYNSKTEKKSVEETIASLKTTSSKDYETLVVNSIELKKIEPSKKKMEEYASDYKDLAVLNILNNVPVGNNIETSQKYMKTIKQTPLLEYLKQ